MSPAPSNEHAASAIDRVRLSTYVHAKVAIVDDRWRTVGSANLNAHSLLNDTEMNVATDDSDLVRDTRRRLWSEHPIDAVRSHTPQELLDGHWIPTAYEQQQRERTNAKPTHRLIALSGVSRRSSRLLGPLTGLIDDD